MNPIYKYLIFDARYNYDEDEAFVFDVCDSLKEAQLERTEHGKDCVIVRMEYID